HAGARHGASAAGGAAIQGRDHGGRGEVNRKHQTTLLVMAGLVPAIHVFASAMKEGVDARVKPGHDELYFMPPTSPRWQRPALLPLSLKTASGNRSAARRRRWRAADSSGRRRTPSAAPR